MIEGLEISLGTREHTCSLKVFIHNMNPQIPKTSNLYKQRGVIHYVFLRGNGGVLGCVSNCEFSGRADFGRER